MGRINGFIGIEIRIFRRKYSEPVSHCLQFAVTASFTEHAQMIAFDKKHIDEISPVFEQFGSVVFDNHTFGCGLCAGSLRFAVDYNRANSAASVRSKFWMVAKSWNINARVIRGLHNSLTWFCFHLDAVNCKGYLVAHC
ncbi:MAG: hypothetical protein BWY69_01187 [Planctomycetes bacterium ADurb.Bin401]|nr:MAG: hypothetical protein BWY69_01187 [Planctomycetes bacterium ADurb.Bin401]